ncbi:MAG: PHP domain-containing protein [Thermoanaerobaculia bacterium]
MLLCDFHIHTTWSDGSLSIAEAVDLFGRSGHDAIAITDHVVNTDSLLGKIGHRLKLSVPRERFDAYRAEIEDAARTAWDRYRMVVLAGCELTRNGLTGDRSAHALALGLDTFVSADGPVEGMLTRAREAGGVTVACHPNEQSDWFANTHYLWNRRDSVANLVDLWELACRFDLFPQVSRASLPFIGNSDFHSPKHLYAWKTLMQAEKSPRAILNALKKGVGLGVTRLQAPAATNPLAPSLAELGNPLPPRPHQSLQAHA